MCLRLGQPAADAQGKHSSRPTEEGKRQSFGSLRVPPSAETTASGTCARNLIGTLSPFCRTVRSL
jgi:hypothetical protein